MKKALKAYCKTKKKLGQKYGRWPISLSKAIPKHNKGFVLTSSNSIKPIWVRTLALTLARKVLRVKNTVVLHIGTQRLIVCLFIWLPKTRTWHETFWCIA